MFSFVGRFSTTFLGHQGWLFQSARTCLLVDPLLCEDFGQAHALEYRVYPPRVLKPESFPKVDAVLLTHEHDDHFDIPSLCKLDRKIPVFLSARSSVAGYRVLTELGFQVRPLVPGVAFQFRDLEVLPLCGDHVNTNTGDEWDTLPFAIRHTEGAGSFFSMVDCTMTPAHIESVRSRIPRPGLVGWTNNTLDRSHMADYLPVRTDATEPFTQRMSAGYTQINELWGEPSAMLMCAGGFAFEGARAWLNGRFFCVDPERVSTAMAERHPAGRFFATRPGQTFHMEGNVLKEVEEQVPFLGTQPREGWPSRQKTPLGELPDYAPATGRRELDKKDLEKLRTRLKEFAESLVGSTLFKSLYSMLDVEAKDHALTFALILRSGAQRMAFVYNPTACTFEPGPADNPRGTYLAGLECWAADMLAVLGGELGPIALSYGRAALWNALPERFNFNIFGELYRISHPLRRPAEVYRTYERLVRKSAGTRPVIQHR